MAIYFQKYIYGVFLSFIFLAFGSYRALEIGEHSSAYQNYMHEHVKVLNFEERLLNVKEWSLLLTEKVLSFVENSEWAEKKSLSATYLAKAESEYILAIEKSIEIGITALVLLLLTLVLYYHKNWKEAFIFPLFSICALFLYLGVFNPMLEISAFSTNLKIPISIGFEGITSPINDGAKWIDQILGTNLSEEIENITPPKLETNIEFKGRMYYYYQSKSVAQLIELLFKDSNYLVAFAILVFSIVLPVLKLLLTLFSVFSEETNTGLQNFISSIGKWSMADVFVASCFLAFLSFSNMNVGIETESNISFGLYFFFGYVLLSMVMSALTQYYSPTTK